MRRLLTLYFVAILCFGLVGTCVLHLYMAGYMNWHNDWSVDTPQPWPMLVLFLVWGFLTYLPFILFYSAPPMVVAALLYVFFCTILDDRAYRPG